ncbi:MAG: hypothetical protein AAF443_06390 [Chlamydiota bacterium]
MTIDALTAGLQASETSHNRLPSQKQLKAFDDFKHLLSEVQGVKSNDPAKLDAIQDRFEQAIHNIDPAKQEEIAKKLKEIFGRELTAIDFSRLDKKDVEAVQAQIKDLNSSFSDLIQNKSQSILMQQSLSITLIQIIFEINKQLIKQRETPVRNQKV